CAHTAPEAAAGCTGACATGSSGLLRAGFSAGGAGGGTGVRATAVAGVVCIAADDSVTASWRFLRTVARHVSIAEQHSSVSCFAEGSRRRLVSCPAGPSRAAHLVAGAGGTGGGGEGVIGEWTTGAGTGGATSPGASCVIGTAGTGGVGGRKVKAGGSGGGV